MIYDTAAKNAKLIAGESNGIRKRSDMDHLLYRGPHWRKKKQGFPRDCFVGSGLDPVGSSHPETARDGIARDTLSTGRDRMGLSCLGNAPDNLDGIQISPDYAGWDFSGP